MPEYRYHISELPKKYKDKCIKFITRSSFELRWLTCINAIKNLNIKSLTIFQSNTISDEASKTYKKLDGTLLKKAEIIDLPKSDSSLIFRTLLHKVIDTFNTNTNELVLIDVSAFKREELFILVLLVKEMKKEFPDVNCHLLYNEVVDMASEWLSKNTLNIRTIIGFSGDPKQSKRTCIVSMIGHELNRAKDIIDAYEPSKILIGRGIERESINSDLFKRNLKFYRELKAYYGSDCTEFKFSLLDPIKVKESLAEICSDDSYNYVLVPLNNKISCIGAALYALENPEVQVCYSEMLDYNKQHYSKAGDYVHILDYKDL